MTMRRNQTVDAMVPLPGCFDSHSGGGADATDQGLLHVGYRTKASGRRDATAGAKPTVSMLQKLQVARPPKQTLGQALPTKNKTVGLSASASNLDQSSSSRRLNHLVSANTSHFSNQMSYQNLLHNNSNQAVVDSLDNASNYTRRQARKQLLEMRKELILLLRFFCLDKDKITELLRGPTGSIAQEGQALFTEGQVHAVLSQVLQSVQDWLKELHCVHDENLIQRETIVRMQSESKILASKLSAYQKTDKMLAASLRQISQASHALLDPIKYEMDFLCALYQLDDLVQSARQNFAQTLSLASVEEVLRTV